MKRKAFGAFLLTFVMIVMAGAAVFAAEREDRLPAQENRVAELQALVEALTEERQILSSLALDFADHVSQLNESEMNDIRHERLRELSALMRDANETYYRIRGYEVSPTIVISGFGRSNEPDCGKFIISITSQEYLEFLDFILEFTGIERDMLEVIIEEPGWVGGWPFAQTTFAAEREDRLPVQENRVAELQALALTLAEESGAKNRLSLYENYSHCEATMNMAKFALLVDFNNFLLEAAYILDRTIGNDGIPTLAITVLSGPHSTVSGKFYIGFTDNKYLELLDSILDFTGIGKEMLEIGVYGIPWLEHPLDFMEDSLSDGCLLYREYEKDEARGPGGITLFMGTGISFRHPTTGANLGVGTLGHPRNAFGGTVFRACLHQVQNKLK